MEKNVPSNPFSLVEFQITHSAKDGLTTKLDFTFREAQIIQFSKNNLSCKEIANHLFISVNTVRKHRRNIITKIGVSGKTDFRKFLRDYPPFLFRQ
jgi:DNA-binding CsgD family transcriptional regulator